METTEIWPRYQISLKKILRYDDNITVGMGLAASPTKSHLEFPGVVGETWWEAIESWGTGLSRAILM